MNLRYDLKRLAPDRHANLWKLAQLLDELGRLEDALREARAAVRIVPNNRAYRDTLTLIERKLSNSAGQAVTPLRDLRAYPNSEFHFEFHFEVSVPNNWQVEIRKEGEIAGGWVSRLLSRLSTLSGGTDVFTATAPRDEGFARMGILVRQIDRHAKGRAKKEFSAETQVSVAGVPAIQVEYVFRGTLFRKIAVQNRGQEYVLQFGHDGTFDTTIDRIIRSFRFL